MNKELIYGKNDLSHIVSIENTDGTCEIFREIDGKITSEFAQSKFWILSDQKIRQDWIRLKGDLHYKYGKQFQTRDEFMRTKLFLKKQNKDHYTVVDPRENTLINKGYTYFKGMKISDVSVFSFDLETTTLDPQQNGAKILLISTTYRSQGKVVNKLFAYDEYETEARMLEDFCSYVRDCNPSILLGHNIFGFDLRYLRGRSEITGTPLLLGRDGSEIKFNKWESKYRKEATQYIHYNSCRIYGREIIDTMFLAIKYDVATRKYESYGLKSIIKQEGLEKQGRTFYDASQIRFKYQDKEEWEKIKQYCLDDSDDALMLFDLMIPVFFSLCSIIPKTFQMLIESASGSQVNALMVRCYLQQGHSIPKADEYKPFGGALSLGFPGVYSNVYKIDIASMYPNIMMQYEVYPKHKDPNKYFLNILEFLTKERIKYKKLAKETGDSGYDAIQNSMKIIINSAFGFMGARGLNFNYMDGAAFITAKGQELIKFTMKWATGEEYQIKEGDIVDEDNSDLQDFEQDNE